MVSEDDVAERVVCGPDPAAHVEAIEEFARAGFDHVAVHQVGPVEDGFFELYANEILSTVAA
jgi:coenzyme F420-dependent glucose-6-phosphate dehydrogenase